MSGSRMSLSEQLIRLPAWILSKSKESSGKSWPKKFLWMAQATTGRSQMQLFYDIPVCWSMHEQWIWNWREAVSLCSSEMSLSRQSFHLRAVMLWWSFSSSSEEWGPLLYRYFPNKILRCCMIFRNWINFYILEMIVGISWCNVWNVWNAVS